MVTSAIAGRAASPARGDRAVQLWLLAVAFMVLAMVVVGGATRLTGSGLSITEWQPIVGAIPPFSDAAWADAFAKYKSIPQYRELNHGMSLEAFKTIFWWEWSHRLLGRLIGVVFFLPGVFFAMSGRIGGALAGRLLLLFGLGGAQGALGWYMVESGLAGRTEVSQYRLAAHLLLASLLFAALIWTALDAGPKDIRRIRLRTHAATADTVSNVIIALVFLQLGLGALVAGLHAGLAYNTWPLMDGHIVPSGITVMQPLWRNIFENAATAQFDHRMLAYIITALVVWQLLATWRADDERIRRSAIVLALAVLCQVGLGISTLLAHVPLDLALTHQATAMLVLGAAVWHRHALSEV